MSFFGSKNNVHANSLGKARTNIFLADKDFKIFYAKNRINPSCLFPDKINQTSKCLIMTFKHV